MPLSDAQKTRLAAEAQKRGLDPAKLIAAAEKAAQAPATKADAAASTVEAPPNLYMYHLPFVTVNEVRTIWLKLDEIPGGDEFAGVWAAKQGASAKPDPES